MTKPTNEEDAAQALRATMDRANETLTTAMGALIAAERARGVDHPTALLGVACALAELVGVARAQLAATCLPQERVGLIILSVMRHGYDDAMAATQGAVST